MRSEHDGKVIGYQRDLRSPGVTSRKSDRRPVGRGVPSKSEATRKRGRRVDDDRQRRQRSAHRGTTAQHHRPLTSQRLKAAIWHYAKEIVEEESESLQATATPQFVSALADLVYAQAGTQHGG
jgi:hypothetical protein